MYENVTFESILQRMLDRIPDDMDKREGSIIYDALAPAAIEMQNMYIELDNTLNETFADTASREYLIKRCAEAGITPKPATKAVIKVSISPFTIDVPIGTRFSSGSLTFSIVSKIDDVYYSAECETIGNIPEYVELIPIDYVEGLEISTYASLITPGTNEESTESLRKRYFERLTAKPFGGNVADYKVRVNEIVGVGGVKVYNPHGTAPGSVSLKIIGSDYRQASNDLVANVQRIIDPTENSGEGLGLAPIGHHVTVEAAETDLLEIDANITYENGYAWADIEDAYNKTLDDYYLELTHNWQESDGLVVRVSQIELRLLDIPGVADVEVNTITSMSSGSHKGNYKIFPFEIPLHIVKSEDDGSLG